MCDHRSERLWCILHPLCEDWPLAVHFLRLGMLRAQVFDDIFFADRRQHLMDVECLRFVRLLLFFLF